MLRQVQESDLQDIYAIFQQKEVEPYVSIGLKPYPEFCDTLLKSLDNSLLDYLIYEDNEKIIGICAVQYFTDRRAHTAYIGSLAIHHQYHGKGYGQKMMNQLFEQFKTRKIIRIELIVETDNPGAIKFYEKLGFEIEGTMKKFYKREYEKHYIDDHIMAKFLEY